MCLLDGAAVPVRTCLFLTIYTTRFEQKKNLKFWIDKFMAFLWTSDTQLKGSNLDTTDDYSVAPQLAATHQMSKCDRDTRSWEWSKYTQAPSCAWNSTKSNVPARSFWRMFRVDWNMKHTHKVTHVCTRQHKTELIKPSQTPCDTKQ